MQNVCVELALDECAVLFTIRTCEISNFHGPFLGVSPREILVYKDCAWNCTFVYTSLQPGETPRSVRTGKTNSFYFTHCCNGMVCNVGGPTNLERDILDDPVIENDLLDGTECLITSAFFLIFASTIASNTLT
ncbi:Glycosyl-phosphatidylinositol-anchored molecule-like protein [Fukomys damarensis]|uniref:Glycosyl-phosphatidylinositol-anchored molecule-like protein n=1 Tax=Fukomys damarensis TaxID=885580 RepID=A0A091D991_FUKDA|nr:Glycosyl-phosphatidylinositol-anchored molecule-like protein [Fukomys damarensis]